MRRYSGEGLLGQFMNLFVPDPIDKGAIPADITSAVEQHLGGEKHKWYLFKPIPIGALLAVDFEVSDPPGRFLHLGQWQPAPSGGLVPTAWVTTPVRYDNPFRCRVAGEAEPQPLGAKPDESPAAPVTVAGSAAAPGTLPPAGGWVWDRRAILIVGFTKDGQELNTVPHNGCWLLVPPEGATGEWHDFQVKDRHRRVIYGREM